MNKYLGIAIVIIILLTLTNRCGYNRGLADAVVKVDSVYVYDSIPVTKTVTITEPTYVIKEIPSVIDTIAVLEDYFAERIYDINERINDCVISFKPAVSQNKLVIPSFTIKNTRPIEYNTFQHAKQSRFALSVHVGYGVSKEGLSPYAGIGISYDLFRFTKK